MRFSELLSVGLTALIEVGGEIPTEFIKNRENKVEHFWKMYLNGVWEGIIFKALQAI